MGSRRHRTHSTRVLAGVELAAAAGEFAGNPDKEENNIMHTERKTVRRRAPSLVWESREEMLLGHKNKFGGNVGELLLNDSDERNRRKDIHSHI